MKMIQWNMFLLIVFTFGMKMHLAQEIPLSDNPEIFDDQYINCGSQMDNVIIGILKKELKFHKEFKTWWDKASNHWNKIKSNLTNLPQGFRNEYGIAVVAYSGKIHQAFNTATRDVGTSIKNYKTNFNFKAMHYFLTRAIQMLSDQLQRKVYRGEKHTFIPSKSKEGVMRFGQFTSTSEDMDTAMTFGDASFFTIQTRLGVNIERFTLFPGQNEVLIPGYELFTVLSFDNTTHSFTLISNGDSSSRFNCAYFAKFNE